ncbi:MAG: glycosyltransferase [Acidobacteriaceae bacterium]|nr:glycosyltransferase [Acidobacteriaceae bacterium]
MTVIHGIFLFFLSLFSPFLAALAALVIAAEDFCFQLFGRKSAASEGAVRLAAASVVIPNWNGRHLLEAFLPSVMEAVLRNPGNEIIVVDNASVDGSADFLRDRFPQVRVLPQSRNLGFGGGSNAGFRAAKNDIVVLLNNDMRVEPDFLDPLLQPFSDPLVFSVSCQIFFPDPLKRREETGLTESWWEEGRFHVSHRIDDQVDRAFPCAYGGGGSSAFDRRKFLELGGFDELLAPFYYEDTDLGFEAWKRGWKVLYQPRSIVYHEHRGTIGKKFNQRRIETVLKKNAVLFCWKNIHDWRLLPRHFWNCIITAVLGTLFGRSQGMHMALGLWIAVAALPRVVRSRWRARKLAMVSDREALCRQRGGYYRDRFDTRLQPAPGRLQVLFLSPYPIEPPIHGGAVFMRETLRALREQVDVHLISFVEHAGELPAQEPLTRICASARFLVRKHKPSRIIGSPLPAVVHEFADRDFQWAIDRAIFLHQIDAVQVEYTMLAQYAGDYERIPTFLFEHDISFQSLGRRLAVKRRLGTAVAYMQVLRYELENLKRFARIQVCSEENARYLLEFAPELAGRLDSDVRAVIDTTAYRYVAAGREPNTVLFIGSFRHRPNVEALEWFLDNSFADVLRQIPKAVLVVAGSGQPPALLQRLEHPNIRNLGFVPDIREELQKYAVLVCPILSGSGLRVKLLEAFASGIPVVSTTLGAEGLARFSGQYCELADSPEEFARSVVTLLKDPEYASDLAHRGRRMVEQDHDAIKASMKLAQLYRGEVKRRRSGLLALAAAVDSVPGPQTPQGRIAL